MHILQVLSAQHHANGVVAHLRLLAPALQARGHRVTVLTRTGSSFTEEFTKAGFETLASDLSRWPLTEVKRIAAWAKAENVDVVHTHMSRSNNFGVALKLTAKLPVVMTAHALTRHPHWLLANQVLAVSESTAQWHRKSNFLSQKRLTTVLNFIDPARLIAPPGARAALRAEWGVGDREILLGTLGEISLRKGHDVLVEAQKQLPITVRLVVVGEGREAFVSKVRQAAAPRVIWAGYRKDIPSVLAALDGFVLASRKDPCPMAVIEALAAGLPVIGSRTDGIPEFVEEGKSGFLATPGDVPDLARALSAFAALTPTERQSFGQAGQAFVHAHATVASQVPQIEAVLERVRKS